MPIQRIFAHLSCADLQKSTPWFETLFGRKPDATPMELLAEWHHGREAGFQLLQNPPHAGKGTLTLIVSGLDAERSRLSAYSPTDIERGNFANLVRLRDPDGNLVVLAEPRNA
jgi:catechol 2,3-dioxygenase-like lactoylglutathione lyase family enzyme